ncbi:MAG: class A beta-lactamase-related serine hydrolase [Gemmatimonadota bacterium]|jgi:beta-lactamase class A|nr:class A beta-lactamase-related serine hydrolase [Gemmatimonadota bacterium]MDH4351963.1 class A beta-lactamase-related serine hydrolase [Gemmatimonadota bacterium]
MRPCPRSVWICCVVALLTGCASAPAPMSLTAPPAPPQPDAALQAELQEAVQGFHGDVGVYVRNLRTGQTAAIRADELFPTASMIKVPILLTTFQALEDGNLEFLQKLTYTDSLAYSDEDDLLALVQDSSTIELAKVAMLMITMSDNTASLWLQSLAGTGLRINEWLTQHGFDSTRMNSRTPGRRPNWEAYGWGQTTPREMAELLVLIREQKAVSPAADQQMYRMLTRIYWNGEALSQIPPWVQAASKQGAVNRSRSEVVLVNAPAGDYVFSVITKNQEDESWESSNEGYVLLRKVSALLWKYFEPDTPWVPAPGAARFTP